MSELPAGGSGRGKRLSKRQLRELLRKQQRSYIRGDKIQEISSTFHTEEEKKADEQLDKDLENL